MLTYCHISVVMSSTQTQVGGITTHYQCQEREPETNHRCIQIRSTTRDCTTWILSSVFTSIHVFVLQAVLLYPPKRIALLPLPSSGILFLNMKCSQKAALPRLQVYGWTDDRVGRLRRREREGGIFEIIRVVMPPGFTFPHEHLDDEVKVSSGLRFTCKA